MIATYCPDVIRRGLVAQSFSEVRRTGVTSSEYELIVVNNGGIQQECVEALMPDLVINCSENIGQPRALNAGIGASRGYYIFQMDDDLSYEDGWLNVGMRLLKKYPRAVIQLREPRYVVGKTRFGHPVVSRHGGCYCATRKTFAEVGPFSHSQYRWASLWERGAHRQGRQFIAAKSPQVFHLGEGLSMQRTVKQWVKTRRQA